MCSFIQGCNVAAQDLSISLASNHDHVHHLPCHPTTLSNNDDNEDNYTDHDVNYW